MNPSRLSIVLLVTSLLLAPLSGAAQELGDDPLARIKRLAIIVPDLDRADLFFTEVLRFRADTKGLLDPSSESYLGVVFPGLPDRPLRRALYHTATEQRGLFVLEVPPTGDAVDQDSGQAGQVPPKKASTGVLTVVESSDLDALQARARAHGFATAFPVSDVSPEGVVFKEVLVTGPGGHAFLVYQYGQHGATP